MGPPYINPFKSDVGYNKHRTGHPPSSTGLGGAGFQGHGCFLKISQYHLVMTNWENPCKWRFIAGKIIYKWTIFHGYATNNQRVFGLLGRNIGLSSTPHSMAGESTCHDKIRWINEEYDDGMTYEKPPEFFEVSENQWGIVIWVWNVMKYIRLFSASLAQANITPRTVGFLVNSIWSWVSSKVS